MRLIDAEQRVVDTIKARLDNHDLRFDMYLYSGNRKLERHPAVDDLRSLLAIVDRLADAPEVVLCKDCKHSQPISERAARAFNAELVRDCTYQRGDWKRVYGFSVAAADGYCDEGERKEGEHG